MAEGAHLPSLDTRYRHRSRLAHLHQALAITAVMEDSIGLYIANISAVTDHRRII